MKNLLLILSLLYYQIIFAQTNEKYSLKYGTKEFTTFPSGWIKPDADFTLNGCTLKKDVFEINFIDVNYLEYKYKIRKIDRTPMKNNFDLYDQWDVDFTFPCSVGSVTGQYKAGLAEYTFSQKHAWYLGGTSNPGQIGIYTKPSVDILGYYLGRYTLYRTEISPVVSSVSSVNFGTSEVNTVKSYNLTLKNDGFESHKIELWVEGAAFYSSTSSFTLGAKKSLDVTIFFNPQSAGDHSGLIKFTENMNTFKTISISGSATQPCTSPVADFLIPEKIVAGQEVNFSNTSTGSPTMSNLWSTGATSQDLNHVFPEAGTFELQLTSSNNCGTNQVTKSIVVEEPCVVPVSLFSTNKTDNVFQINEEVVFSNESTGTSNTYEWTIGANVYYDESPKITFETEGSYTATLIAKNACGEVSSQVPITVVKPFPVAKSIFITSLNTVSVGQSIPVQNFSSCSDNRALENLWEWKNGTSTEKNPTNIIFQEVGTHRVCLRVNPLGFYNNSDYVYSCQTVIVEPLAQDALNLTLNCPTASYTEGETVNLSAATNYSDAEITWSLASGKTFLGNSISFASSVADNGQLTCTATYNSEIVTESCMITVLKQPIKNAGFCSDFNSSIFDPHWHLAPGVRSSDIRQENGIIKVEQNITDKNTSLHSDTFLVQSAVKFISFEKKTLMHAANSYFYGNSILFFNDTTAISVDNRIDRWSNINGINLHSSLGKIYKNEFVQDAIFDKWYKEKLIYHPSTGLVEYFINDKLAKSFSSGIIKTEPFSFYIRINGYDWWTGHYHLTDDFCLKYEAIEPVDTVKEQLLLSKEKCSIGKDALVYLIAKNITNTSGFKIKLPASEDYAINSCISTGKTQLSSYLTPAGDLNLLVENNEIATLNDTLGVIGYTPKNVNIGDSILLPLQMQECFDSTINVRELLVYEGLLTITGKKLKIRVKNLNLGVVSLQNDEFSYEQALIQGEALFEVPNLNFQLTHIAFIEKKKIDYQ